ncbi:glutathione S-transferase [soil metagenome]
MLTIWGRRNSHNGKKVAGFADELGVANVRHEVGGQFGMDAAYLALNPNRLIPTIEEDGLVLWESNAIVRYLAQKHGGERWWPADAAERANGDKWMDWQFSIADAQRGAFHGLVRTPPEKRDLAAIADSARKSGHLMAVVDSYLARQSWLSGAEFGIGDIPVGVYAHTFYTLAVERPDLPHLRAWYERLIERPAYAKSVMIPLT